MTTRLKIFYSVQNVPTVLTKQMDLVDYNKCHFLNVVSLLPRTANTIPFLWRRNNDVCFFKQAYIRRVIACKFNHCKHALKFAFPVCHALSYKRFQWPNVHNFTSRMVAKDFEHAEFCGGCFAGTSRRTDKHTIIAMVAYMKHLSLHRIEELKRKQGFQLRVFQGLDRQWLEIKQRCVWRMPLW